VAGLSNTLVLVHRHSTALADECICVHLRFLLDSPDVALKVEICIDGQDGIIIRKFYAGPVQFVRGTVTEELYGGTQKENFNERL